MISVEEAQKIILNHIHPMGLERVGLIHALGRVSGEEIKSGRDIPPWDNSAMDGFAVKSADLKGAGENKPVVLKVVEDLPAGYVSKRTLRKGEAIRIMTGAPMPAGSDAVVVVEATRTKGVKVHVYREVEKGENIRRQGEDIRARQTVLVKESHLTPAVIGMLASVGRSSMMVHQVPHIAILSTGDELVYVDEELSPGKIVNSNSYSLAAMTKECGAIPVQLGIARDTREELEEKLQQALTANVIISTGGISVGQYDYVKDVLKKMGMEMKFWKVAMRPGQPQAFGVIEGKPVFGLPGNPVSSMVSFELFVRPSILKMMGFPNIFRRVKEARLKEKVRTKGGKKYFLRGRLEYEKGVETVTPLRTQGSAMLMSMAKANCLIIIPEDMLEVRAGKLVKVVVLDPNFNLEKRPGF